MTRKKTENKTSENRQEDARLISTDDAAGELARALWSVISFEGVAARNLNYDEAIQTLKKLESQKVFGLCIVTDEAAARITESSKQKAKGG